MLLHTLLGVWAIGKTVTSTPPIFMRLAVSMAAVTFVVVFMAVLAAMIVAGMVGFSYVSMVDHGLEPKIALLILAAALLTVLTCGIVALQFYWNRVSRLSKHLIYMQAPITSRVHLLAQAFLQGLNK